MGRILLLEDDLTLSETVVDYFEEEGFEVVAVYDGDEANDVIYENKFDLFLLDVNVPSMNGFELLKAVRAEGNITPAIFITSLNSMNSLEEGFESGCDDYIRKPFELKELLIHDRIYDYVWDYDEQYSDNSLRTYIKNLRKVLGKDRIVSLKKLGYRFNSK